MQKNFLSKLNIIDLLIAAAITAAVISVLLAAFGGSSKTQKTEYRLTASCIDCPDRVFELLTENSECILYDTQSFFAELLSKQNDDTPQLLLGTAAKPLRHGIDVGGEQILVGKYINLIISDCIITVRIDSFTPDTEDNRNV